MTSIRARLRSIGAWSPGLEGWPAMRDALRVPDAALPPPRTARPSPALLPAAERRRAPDGVAVALEVAREAIAIDDIDPTRLATVFVSAHGDLAIVDYLCTTLASDATLLSPLRFHHSVHNAAAGYWSIATHCTAPSTALAAGDDSFAVGLLEAATQVTADRRPVLLVAFDTPAVGLLSRAVHNSALIGIALLLAPADDRAPAIATLDIALADRSTAPPGATGAAMRTLAASSPSARGLALLQAIATERDTPLDLPLGALTLVVNVAGPARSIG